MLLDIIRAILNAPRTQPSLVQPLPPAKVAAPIAEADTIAKLDALFARAAGPRPVGSHRGEATVFLIDVSGSMIEAMGKARRIDAVSTAMLGLLRFKQARWS